MTFTECAKVGHKTVKVTGGVRCVNCNAFRTNGWAAKPIVCA